MYTLLNDKINDKLGDGSNVEKQIDSLSWTNVNLSKLNVLESTCETIRKEIKKKKSDTKVLDEAAKKFEECMEKEPEFKKISDKACYGFLTSMGEKLNALEWLRSQSELEDEEDDLEMLEKCEKMIKMASIPGISKNEYFKQKFIDSGFLPPFSTVKEFTYEGMKIVYGIGLRTYENIINTYLDIIVAGEFSGYQVSADEYLSQAKRFLTIATNIFENEQEDFLNDYYPFTQKKELKKVPVVIADSDIMNYENCGYYTKKASFKLSIEPHNFDLGYFAHSTEEIRNYSVVISENSSSDKTPPIYDMDNVPSRPVKVKVKYLKEEELQVGHIYIEKADGTKLIYIGLKNSGGYSRYYYLRYSKKAEVLARECKNIDELLKKIKIEQLKREYKERYDRPECKTWYPTLESFIGSHSKDISDITTLSAREKPRKFIADVGALTFKE